MENRDDYTSKLAWFLTGAAVGASVAILFAPKSGKETRKIIGDTTQRGWRQLLTSDLHLYHGYKWSAYGTTSFDLTSGDWYSYAMLDYVLDHNWRVGLLGNWYRLDETSLSDQEIYVGRKLFQNREVGLSWSRLTGKLSLELLGWTTQF